MHGVEVIAIEIFGEVCRAKSFTEIILIGFVGVYEDDQHTPFLTPFSEALAGGFRAVAHADLFGSTRGWHLRW